MVLKCQLWRQRSILNEATSNGSESRMGPFLCYSLVFEVLNNCLLGSIHVLSLAVCLFCFVFLLILCYCMFMSLHFFLNTPLLFVLFCFSFMPLLIVCLRACIFLFFLFLSFFFQTPSFLCNSMFCFQLAVGDDFYSIELTQQNPSLRALFKGSQRSISCCWLKRKH